MVRLTPFVVVAHLQQGVVLDSRYGTALDGLLASVVRDNQKQQHYQKTGLAVTGSQLDGGLDNPEPTVVELPLQKCFIGGENGWHWACTTAYPVGVHTEFDVHYRYCQIKENTTRHTTTNIPKHLHSTFGRYRTRKVPVVTTVTNTVVWRVVGDPDLVEELLTPITTIGKHRNNGEGTVLGWNIFTHLDGDPFLYGHTHPDGTLGRPIPTECAQQLNLPTTTPQTAGIRPPYWHPANQKELIIPQL